MWPKYYIFICHTWQHNSEGRDWICLEGPSPENPVEKVSGFLLPQRPQTPWGAAFPSFPSALFPPNPRPWMGSPGEGGKNPRKAPHQLKLSLSIPFLDRIHFLTCEQGENLFSHLASPPRSLLGHTWHSPLNRQFGLSLHSQLPLCVWWGWGEW